MFLLQMRMMLLLSVLFAIVYATIVVIGTSLGVGNFNFYLMISIGMMFIQYLIGPKMVEWSMQIRYIKREEDPELYDMIADQAKRSGISMPRVCISAVNIPNAFAFGRGFGDGRVCVTQGIRRLLNKEELKAVIGHEVTHLKNNDVLTITLLSVIPIIMYRLAWHLMWYGGRRSSNDNGPSGAVLGMIAFLFYFITNLLVLYASRVREYFADRGSVENGNRPEALATALYKLVYGAARADRNSIKEAEGLKAFFLNDPSRAHNEIRELAQLDLDKSGHIDAAELLYVRNKKITLNFGDHLMELLSTNPNMLRRIKHLSELK